MTDGSLISKPAGGAQTRSPRAAVASAAEGGRPSPDFGEGRDLLSELWENRERFRLAIIASQDGFWDWDIATDHVVLFGQHHETLGYAPAELPKTFAAWKTLIHPEDRPQLLAAVERHLKERVPYVSVYRIARADGTYLWWRSKGQAVWDEAGKPVRMLGSDSDITDLVEAKRAAQEASLKKTDFLANLSHELRNPLHGIVGMATVLRHHEDRPDQLKRIDTILASGRSMLDLIEELLDVARIEAGAPDLQSEAIEPETACRAALDVVQANAAAKGLELRLEGGDVPRLRGDKRRFHQVLINLLGNAVKFTGAGSVTLRYLRGAEGAVRFEVADTGVGIAPEDIARIFERFAKGSSIAFDNRQGAGLGLAICRALVTAMRGEIGALSRPDGATFWVEMPAWCEGGAG